MRDLDRERARAALPRLGSAGLGVALLLTLSACSSEETPEPDRAAATATESTTTGPGPEVEGRAARFQAPDGFAVAAPRPDSPALVATGPSGSAISLVEVGLAGEPPELDRQQEIAREGLGSRFRAEEPVEVDGVQMWHLSGGESGGTFTDVYGAVVDGTAVRLTIRLAGAEYDAQERVAVNEQVLRSWSWG